MSGYDHDVSTYDPQGRVHQVAYAQEAPRLGAPVVGLVNASRGVLVAVRRAPSRLAAYQPKTFRVARGIGCAAAGIYADVRRLLRLARGACQDREYAANEPLGVEQLVVELSDEAQQRTQYAGLRPFGAALLLLATQDGRPALYATDPSGEYRRYRAHALGRAAQAASSFLQQHIEEAEGADEAALVALALRALRQAGATPAAPAAVEVAALEAGGAFRQLPAAEVAALVERFLADYPVVEDDTDASV